MIFGYQKHSDLWFCEKRQLEKGNYSDSVLDINPNQNV